MRPELVERAQQVTILAPKAMRAAGLLKFLLEHPDTYGARFDNGLQVRQALRDIEAWWDAATWLRSDDDMTRYVEHVLRHAASPDFPRLEESSGLAWFLAKIRHKARTSYDIAMQMRAGGEPPLELHKSGWNG